MAVIVYYFFSNPRTLYGIQRIATTKEGLGRIQIADSDVLLDGQAELCSFVCSGFEQIAVTNMPKKAPTSASADVKAYFEYKQQG
jgi:hypothetical protein